MALVAMAVGIVTFPDNFLIIALKILALLRARFFQSLKLLFGGQGFESQTSQVNFGLLKIFFKHLNLTVMLI